MTASAAPAFRGVNLLAMPLGRAGTIDDVTPLVTLLLSEDSAFITGAGATSLPTGGCYPAVWLELPFVGPPGLCAALGSRRLGLDGMNEGEAERA